MASDTLTVHAPIHLRITEASRVALYVGDTELTPVSFAEAKQYYGERLHRVVFSRMPRDVSLFETETNTIFIVPVSDSMLPILSRALKTWRQTRIVFELTPNDKLLRMMNYLTAAGFPVRLSISAVQENIDLLLRCLDFYLHNQTLSVPMDPFHSLFAAACAGRRLTFWTIESEDPNRDIFIDAAGQIGPSAGLIDAGYRYGTLDDSYGKALDSKMRHQLRAVVARPEAHHPGCKKCAIVDRCRGYLALHGGISACDMWREVCRRIDVESLKIQDIVMKLRAEEPNDA